MPKSRIPTVAEACERFVDDYKRNNKSWREHASVLLGPPSGRVVGRQAAGPALGRSELGPVAFSRVTADQFRAWWNVRHPLHLAPSTRKRGRSSLRQLLLFAVAHGWTDDSVLLRLPDAKPSPPRGDWLRPEQVVVLDALVTEERFTAEQCFQWRTLLAAGLRVNELVTLKAGALNPTDRALTVTGKFGKTRTVPVSETYCNAWLDYVLKRNLRSTSWMFPLTGVRFTGGGTCERVVLSTARHCDAKAVRSMLSSEDRVSVMGLARECVIAGRMPAQLLPPRLTPHTLRRTYATNYIISGVLLGPEHGLDLRSLQEAMGHESLETTAEYLSDVSAYVSRFRRPADLVENARRIVEEHRDDEAEAA